MKQHILLIFSLFMAWTASAQSVLNQKTDFKIENKSIAEALVQLSKENDINISFSPDIIPVDYLVSIDKTQTTIGKILDEILKGHFIRYKTIDNQIVLYYRAPPKKKFTISGYIEDSKSGEKLILANIYLLDKNIGTTSNNYGFFSLTLEEGDNEIFFSYLGYKTQSIEVNLNRDKNFTIGLVPSLTLDEIVVLGKDSLRTIERIQSTHDLGNEQMDLLPTAGGELDILRATHLLPGVQTGADGLGGLHVRGGNSDQNLVMLDGVPIYNPFHLAGIISVFNNSAIKSAQLSKGNFPARYGGRLSSVLDVRTREGNTKEISGEFGISMFSINGLIEGPISKGKGSFLLSGRQSLLNFYVKPISKTLNENQNRDGQSSYNFYDLNAKLNYKISKKDKLFLSLYYGNDEFEDEYSYFYNVTESSNSEYRLQELKWGNNIAAFRWNHLFNNKLFSNLSINLTNYNFRSRELVEDIKRFAELNPDSSIVTESNNLYSRFSSEIEDIGARLDFDYFPSSNHVLKFGGGVSLHKFAPGVLLRDISIQDTIDVESIDFLDTVIENSVNRHAEYYLYVEDQINLGKRLDINIGLRSNAFIVRQKSYVSFEPRLSIIYKMTDWVSWNASWTRMSQNLHLLTRSGIGLPADLWVPSTKLIRPQTAWQGVLGLQAIVGSSSRLSIEGYYKELQNVINFKEGSPITFIDANNWENKVTTGRGWSYGAEFLFEKKSKRLTGWVSYTLAWANREFPELNRGNVYPFKYDRRHNIKAAMFFNVSRKLQFSANFLYGTGIAITLPKSQFEFYSPSYGTYFGDLILFGDKNSFRLPSYHRLDIAVNYNINGKFGNHKLKFGVYNIYNKKNPLYYRLGRDPDNPSKRSYLQASIFPIFPFLSYFVRI